MLSDTCGRSTDRAALPLTKLSEFPKVPFPDLLDDYQAYFTHVVERLNYQECL